MIHHLRLVVNQAAHNGYTIDAELTVPEAISARNDGIRIFSVGITDNVNEQELREMSSLPQIEGLNFWRSSDFTMLNDIIDTLVTETCATAAPPTAGPGKHTTSVNCNIVVVCCSRRIISVLVD